MGRRRSGFRSRSGKSSSSARSSKGYTAPKQDELVERYPGAVRVVRRPQRTDGVASEREDIDDDLKFPHPRCGCFLKNAIDATLLKGKDSYYSEHYRSMVLEYCGIEVDVGKLDNGSFGTSPESSSSSRSSKGYTAQDGLVERYAGVARVVRRPLPTDDVASESADVDDDLKFPHPRCGRFLKNAIDATLFQGKDSYHSEYYRSMVLEYCGIEVDVGKLDNGSIGTSPESSSSSRSSKGYTAQDGLVERYPRVARVVRRPLPTDDVASERADVDDDLKFPHPRCGRFLKNAIDATLLKGKDSYHSEHYRSMVLEYCGIEVDVGKLDNGSIGTSPESSSSSTSSKGYAAQDGLVERYPGVARVIRRPLPTDDVASESADVDDDLKFPHPRCGRFLKTAIETTLLRGKDCGSSVHYQSMVRYYCGIEVDVGKSENGSIGTSPGKD
ncbi:unnamed protein product [Prunus armeniaca]